MFHRGLGRPKPMRVHDALIQGDFDQLSVRLQQDFKMENRISINNVATGYKNTDKLMNARSLGVSFFCLKCTLKYIFIAEF